MVAYYEPLYEWLKAENKRLGVTSGWDSAKSDFFPFEEMDFVGKCADTSTQSGFHQGSFFKGENHEPVRP